MRAAGCRRRGPRGDARRGRARRRRRGVPRRRGAGDRRARVRHRVDRSPSTSSSVPGNAYVAAAKREVAGIVGIESLAGPSEVVVVADDTADAALVAADLIAQAEHGPGGRAVLVTWIDAVADAVDAAVDRAGRRGTATAPSIAETLATGGQIVLVDTSERATVVVNEIAPEHVELLTERSGVARRRHPERGRDLLRTLGPCRDRRLRRRREPRAPDRRAPRGSRARCASTTSASTSHVVDVDEGALRARRALRRDAGRRRGARASTRARSPCESEES